MLGSPAPVRTWKHRPGSSEHSEALVSARRAPQHLRGPTRAWWRAVVAEYELDEHHERLLSLAAGAWDRCEQAREALGEHGLTFTDRHGGVKPRPEVAIERDSRIAFARLIRELDLDGEPGPEPRPPRRS